MDKSYCRYPLVYAWSLSSGKSTRLSVGTRFTFQYIYPPVGSPNTFLLYKEELANVQVLPESMQWSVTTAPTGRARAQGIYLAGCQALPNTHRGSILS